jgi:uncharacterized Zn finger protein
MAWRRSRDYWNYFPPSRPREAKGGIKSQSKRGTFGESWWAKRWIAVLEGFDIGARLQRGRSYARKGQVLSIAIEKGIIRAKVQGSMPKPYEIAIQVRVIADADWDKLAGALSRQALHAAKLLAGEMPQDIETIFKEVGLSLFPAKLGDLSTKCSCPDWSNPCKHIAAVYYLLGEEFDRDPFLIFTLRGMSRDELLERLGREGESVAGGAVGFAVEPPPTVLAAEPLAREAGAFWGFHPPDDPFGVIEPPPSPAVLPRRLGGFPFWRGETPFLDAVGPIYAAASPRGLDAFLGQKPGRGPPAEAGQRP